MPSPKICNKIKDPKKRQQCKNYEGPYAKVAKGNGKNQKKGMGNKLGY